MAKVTQNRKSGAVTARMSKANDDDGPAQDDPHDEWKLEILECWLEYSLKLRQIAGHPDISADEAVAELDRPAASKKLRRKAA